MPEQPTHNRRAYLFGLWSLVWVLVSVAGYAQSPPSTSPRLLKDPVADQYDQVRSGVQDRAGNMWFGTTRSGVYRYDGRRFTRFTTADGLSNNTIWAILPDDQGRIWLGTDDGLCRYDGKRISQVPIAAAMGSPLMAFSSLATAPPAGRLSVWCMLRDRKGQLWFGTSKGVYRYDGTSFTRLLITDLARNPAHARLESIQCMLEDANGNLWFGPGASQVGIEALEGLCRYDGRTLTAYKPNGDGWIRSLVQDCAGVIWFGTRHSGTWRYDGKTYAKFTAQADLGAPRLVDKAGNVWFGGGEHDNGYGGAGGIWRYDGKAFTNLTPKDGLGDYSVWLMLQDRVGHIWVGTRNTGLYRYDGKRFTSFSE